MIETLHQKIREYRECVKDKIYGPKRSSKSYIRWLRESGVKIGEGTTFFDPQNTFVDPTRPYMIEIGDNVQITRGVIILTHGYDWAVLKNIYGDILGSCGRVIIGNNVFIGMNTIILKGVTIGNNVIVGANSLVNHNLQDNGVYIGSPAKFIMSVADYYEKRKKAQLQEAKEQVLQYEKTMGKRPDKEILREFFYLFENYSSDNDQSLFPAYEKMLHLTGNYEVSKKRFIETRPSKMFSDIDDFIDFCEKNKKQFIE